MRTGKEMSTNKEHQKNSILSNSLIYTLSGLLIKCFGFFLLPLYTAFLSTEDYGITGLASNFLGTMSFIAAFSLYSAVVRFYVDLKDSKEKLKQFYGTVVIFIFISSILLGFILTLLQDIVSRLFFSGIPFHPIIQLCLISLVFQCQHTIFENILKSQQRAMLYSVLSIAYFLVTITLTLVFVTVYKMGATGVVLATLLAGLLYSLFFIAYMVIKKEISFKFNLELLREALKYSIPIMPHNLSTQIASLLSMGLIGGQSSLSNLGIYTIASQFGNLADTVQGYANQAYGPWLYEKLHKQDSDYKNEIRGTAKLLTAAIGLFLLGISLLSHEYIVLFTASEYKTSWRYVPLIVSVFSIKTMYYFYVEVLFYYKKASRFLFAATLSSSLINILLSYILIPKQGILGSILADGISMIVRVAIIVSLSRKCEDIGLRIWDFILNMVCISIFILIGTYPSFKGNINQFSLPIFLYELLVVFAYIILMFIQNRKQILRMLKRGESRR